MEWSPSPSESCPDWGNTNWQVLDGHVHVKEEPVQVQLQDQLPVPAEIEQTLVKEELGTNTNKTRTTATASSATAPLATATKSGVDGIGLWKSWTHNYEQPRFACLDLIDNCFDATLLQPQQNTHEHSKDDDDTFFEGKIRINSFGNNGNGMSIINNSFKNIKPLEETLTAYRSEKNSANTSNNTPSPQQQTKQEQQSQQQQTLEKNAPRKDAIGEYGVGLKQACATLSDTSFVLTRNNNTLQLGIIAKTLQTRTSVSFPQFSFTIERSNASNTTTTSSYKMMTKLELEQELTERITTAISSNKDVLGLVARELGNGNHKQGVQTLVQRFITMCMDDEWHWNYHANVFQLLLTNLIHISTGSTTTTNSSSGQNNNTHTHSLLQEVKELLPKYYINIPLTGFNFYLNNERVLFSYWQLRLVEMTKFTVYIPKDRPIADIHDDNWFQQGYQLSIYCGFDALRVVDGKQPKTCQLNIYSRASGRLITVEDDARALLGLGSSGVDFSQGLTVIVDDVGGELPLKPTKDGITWSKDAKGEAHKNNLLAWTGAVVFQYWKHHVHMFAKKCESTESKTLLTRAVKSFAEPVKALLHEEQERMMASKEDISLDDNDDSDDPSIFWKKYERLEKAKFTMFSDVTWKKKISTNDMKLKILRSGRQVVAWPGPATVHKFDDRHYTITEDQPQVKATPASTKATTNKRARKSTNAKNSRRDNDDDNDESSSGSEEEEEVQLWNFPRRTPGRTSAPSKSTMLRRNSSGYGSSRSSTTTKRGLVGQNAPIAATAIGTNQLQRRYASKIQQLEQQVQSLHLSLQTCQRDKLVAQDQVSRLQESLQSAFDQISGLESQVQNAEDRRISDVSALQRENAQLKLQLQQKNKTIEQLRQEQEQRTFGNWGGWGGLDSV